MVMELKNCTFQPAIDKKSKQMAQRQREAEPQKSYEALHKKYIKQMERAKNMLKEKEQKEMGECTFAPTINKRKVPLAEPGSETKIQTPGTSLISKNNQSAYLSQSVLAAADPAQSQSGSSTFQSLGYNANPGRRRTFQPGK